MWKEQNEEKRQGCKFQNIRDMNNAPKDVLAELLAVDAFALHHANPRARALIRVEGRESKQKREKKSETEMVRRTPSRHRNNILSSRIEARVFG